MTASSPRPKRSSKRKTAAPIHVAVSRDRLRHDERKFAETGNPLYVFAALRDVATSVVHTRGILDARTARERRETLEQMTVSLPGWIVGYLVSVATRLIPLKHGVAPSDWGGRWPHYPDAPKPRSISAEEASRHLLNVFGFTSRGRNMIDAYWREQQSWAILDAFMTEKERGASATEAKERVMDAFGIEDERTVRRHLARVMPKKPRRKPPKKRPE